MNDTRKNTAPIKVYVTPEEKEDIKAKANQAGLSTGGFLREVGLGYKIESVIDHEKVMELVKINADLGRLGGLLKMWLTNDEKLQAYNPVQIEQTIRVALDKIIETQNAMYEAAKKV